MNCIILAMGRVGVYILYIHITVHCNRYLFQ